MKTMTETMTSLLRPLLQSRTCIRALLLAGLCSLPAALMANPLVSAAQADARSVVLNLLDDPANDVNQPASNGTTALHWAVYNEDALLVERLLAAGAEPDVVNDYGSRPMLEAAKAGNIEILRLLLAAGADVESANAEGQTALMTVARSDNVEAAQLLLAQGAEVNARENWKEQTALIWAAAQGQPEMVAALIAAGADVDARSSVNEWARQITAEPRYMWRPLGGFTALIYAAREGCLACVEHLLAAGANIDQADGEARTPLLISIINLHFDVAKRLIESGANVNKWDLWGEQPLYAAVDMHTLPAGGFPDRPSTDETTALEVIDLLLARNANPNAQLKLMLHHRSIKDDRGADPILTTGATPLLRAAKVFDLPVVKRLIEHGAIVDLPNEQGITPLMAASGLGPTQVDVRGDYTLTDIQERSLATIEQLLAAGADIHRRNEQGYTPLHGAAWWGWDEVVSYLVEQGADPTAESDAGISPLGVAQGEVPMGYGRGNATANNPATAALLEQLMSGSS